MMKKSDREYLASLLESVMVLLGGIYSSNWVSVQFDSDGKVYVQCEPDLHWKELK